MPRRLSRTGLWSRLRNRHPLSGVLSASALEQVFQQERSRADRSGKCFSMVVFLPADGSPAHLPKIVRLVKERMRIYDSLGQLDPRRLALLLPEADSRGAWTLTDDIVELCEEQGVQVQCEVYSYPIDWTRSEDDGSGVRRHALRIAGGEEPRDTPPEETTAPAPQKGADHTGEAGSSEHESGPTGDRSGTERTGTDGVALAVPSPLPSPLPGPLPGPSPEPHVKTEPARMDVGMTEPLAHRRPVFDLAPLFVEPLPLGKRLLDVIVAGTALVALTPLFVVVAIAIKLDSPGPLIFRQRRAGLGGKPFDFYKFRSMHLDAEARLKAIRHRNVHKDGPIFKDPNDPRITRVGRFIRKYSIDELPQFFNVLRGDMTLIGPRPPKVEEVLEYEPWQRRRLEVMGGLTCIWQVSGRSEVGFEDWVRMDIQYQRRKSPWLDFKLLLKTFGAVFSGRGAY